MVNVKVCEFHLHLQIKENEVGLTERLGGRNHCEMEFLGAESVELLGKGSGSQPETKEVCPKAG